MSRFMKTVLKTESGVFDFFAFFHFFVFFFSAFAMTEACKSYRALLAVCFSYLGIFFSLFIDHPPPPFFFQFALSLAQATPV